MPVKSESIDVLIINLEKYLYGEVQFEGGNSAGIEREFADLKKRGVDGLSMISEKSLVAKSAELYLYWRILGIGGWRKQNNKTTTPNAVGFRLRQGHHTGRGRKST